jgi:hypothetical protein
MIPLSISADQVTGNPKVKGIYQQGKAITPVMRKLCLGKERRVKADNLVHGFYVGVFVGSFSRFVLAVCACFFIFCF